jgi:hypothetical protein
LLQERNLLNLTNFFLLDEKFCSDFQSSDADRMVNVVRMRFANMENAFSRRGSPNAGWPAIAKQDQMLKVVIKMLILIIFNIYLTDLSKSRHIK